VRVRDGSADAARDAATSREHYCSAEHDNCADYNEVCVFEKHRCGQCTQETRSDQCGFSNLGFSPQCDLETNRCVECLEDVDCRTPFTACHPTRHVCTVPCTADGCFPFGFGVCEEGFCSQCRYDTDCVTLNAALQGLPFLRIGLHCSHNACVDCLRDLDCPGTQPGRCSANGSCLH
jgi:hypothetical protein